MGSEALKARYLDGLTQTDMNKLTQGGQFMTGMFPMMIFGPTFFRIAARISIVSRARFSSEPPQRSVRLL